MIQKQSRIPRKPAPTPIFVVDEPVERTVTVGNEPFVVFKPGDVLFHPYAVRMARENGIALRERTEQSA